jgi:aldehyde:ferredoxin oxidoreductase
MLFGFNGKILHIDLSLGEITVENPPEAFYRLYGGGTAMGTYYLLKHVPERADPLGPENILTVFVGPATGAPVSGQSRVAIAAKSPLTGGVGDSQGGGFWPAAFKRTGFDGIVIRGKSEKPVYLWIHDGVAELRHAEHLWGKVTGEVEAALREELNSSKIDVLQIGPAGEKHVRIANIINMLNRANGRTGMGAVMGSKNLKAIVIQPGKGPKYKDQASLKELASWGKNHFEESDVFGLGKYGTANVLAVQQSIGGLPTHNWSGGHFEYYQQLTGKKMADTVLKERDTCFACIVSCKRVVEFSDGDFSVDPAYGGPEYETLAALGSYCGVDDLKAVCKANEICNKYGLDTISCGAIIAWAMDCYERGIITKEETDGLDLSFGNADVMVRLVEKIANREGFGNILAEGSARAAVQFGQAAEDLVVAVKNSEMPAHMPEAKRSLALIYAVTAFGADHQSSEHDTSFTPEYNYETRMAEIGLYEPQPARDLGDKKVHYSMYTQWVYSALNSLSICQFVFGPAWHLYSTGQLVQLVQAATGWNFSMFELMKLGERTINLQRVFNLREGLTNLDDRLPKKLFQPKKGGPTDGVHVSEAELDQAIKTYYKMAGWNDKGIPTIAKLEELGIGWAGEMLPST